jgi:hypothetical protein
MRELYHERTNNCESRKEPRIILKRCGMSNEGVNRFTADPTFSSGSGKN